MRSTRSESFEPVDAHTTPQSLARAVLARRSEYVRSRQTRIKIGTWNVAACRGTDKDLARWFVEGQGIDQQFAALDLSRHPAVTREASESKADDPDSVRLVGGDDIGLYVLGLQEVVDLNLTREYVSRAVKVDTSCVEQWQAALEAAMPPGYQLIMAEQMTGLMLLIYASPTVAPTVTNVSTKQVGTGLLGWGNKGAVATRLVLGETTRMVFVNCHLASGAASNHLDRRCWDIDQILSKTKFDAIVHAGIVEDEGEMIGDEDFAFWFGDLNFRLDGLPADDIRRILTLHTRGEYALNTDQEAPRPLDGEEVVVLRVSESDDDTTTKSSNHSREQSFDSQTTLPDPDDFPEDPSQDPSSLQATLDSLLPHDQLRKAIAQKRAFHDGWREGPISFLPTYKYDVGTVGLFDSSEKQRCPSWCDRILYRTRRDKLEHDERTREEREAKEKDEEMKSRGIEEDDDVLFSYDPETDGDDQATGTPALDYDEYDETQELEGPTIATKEGYVDRIGLDIYTSHQRISSSDHKPVISVFTLEYEAVVPELKAEVQAKVARELDRAENERRPSITIVMEGPLAVDESAVDFQTLSFLEKKSCSATVANTGGVAANFSFAEKPETDESGGAVPDWLTTSFARQGDDMTRDRNITLDPGETTVAHIDAQICAVSHLRSLNDGQARLEDVLVIRVDGGRDYFISVKASWEPTCFGRSIDELIRIPDGGIRQFLRTQGIRGAIPYDSDIRCSAPKELFKLTEVIQTLAERCVADEAMLEDMVIPKEAGWPFDSTTWTSPVAAQDAMRAEIVSALDTDAPIVEALPVEMTSVNKLELVSSVLLLFLASLTDGLITPLLWAKLSAALPNLTSCPLSTWADIKSQILDIFSSAPNHSIAFVFLTSTLSRVASELNPVVASPPAALTRRLSFMKGDDDWEKRRKLRQRRYAEIFGPLVSRSLDGEKLAKERARVALEIFLGRDSAI